MNKEKPMEHFVVSGLVLNEKEAKVTIKEVQDKPGIAGFIFTTLAEVSINVDMIIQSSSERGKNDITFTVEGKDLEAAKKVIGKVKETLGAQEVIYDADMAKVSLVGAGMQSHPGVAARMFSALGKKGINIDLISTSEIKISCVVKRDKGSEAVRAIHEEFKLEKEEEIE